MRKDVLFVTAFVGLNILDAYMTGVSLALGSSELNPIATAFGSNILIKALIASAIGIAFVLFKRGKLLKPLVLGMSLIVLWNGLAIWSWT
ncbi:MAG: DUF5658 family protein [Dehalococcoidia bacterium]